MKTKDINNRYSQLVKDISFDKLDLELKKSKYISYFKNW